MPEEYYDLVTDDEPRPRRGHSILERIAELIEERDRFEKQRDTCVRNLGDIAGALGVEPDYTNVMASIKALKEDRVTRVELEVVKADREGLMRDLAAANARLTYLQPLYEDMLNVVKSLRLAQDKLQG